MPKKLDLPTEKKLVKLVKGDAAVLQQFYPDIGYNAVVRSLVHRHAMKLKERESREGVIQHARTKTLGAELDTADSLGLSRDGAEPGLD